MRHRRKSEKFSRPRAQRRALIRSLVRALLIHESIKTTESKAKALRSCIDKLIEWGKDNTLHARRQAYKILNDHHLVKRLFGEIAPRYSDIKGGYTRIIDITQRKGDGAHISLFELTHQVKKKATKKVKKEKEVLPKEEKKGPHPLKKEAKPPKGFMKGVRSIFKKERDAL